MQLRVALYEFQYTETFHNELDEPLHEPYGATVGVLLYFPRCATLDIHGVITVEAPFEYHIDIATAN